MKKTSRRSFGKHITAAMAALPVAILTTAPDAAAQTRKQTKSREPQARGSRSEHNTPPPLFFTPGSLIIEAETDKNDWNTYVSIPNRKKWLVRPKRYPHSNVEPTRLYIAHVKVLSGAGEMIFPYDNQNDIETPIHITATLKKGRDPFGDCHLTVEGDSFAIDVPDQKKLKKKNNDHPTNPKRQRVRYMHDSNDDDDCNFVALKIDKGAANLYHEPNMMQLPGFDELRVMVWWANLPEPRV